VVPGGSVDQLVSSGFAETTWKTTCFPDEISAIEFSSSSRDKVITAKRDIRVSQARFSSRVPILFTEFFYLPNHSFSEYYCISRYRIKFVVSKKKDNFDFLSSERTLYYCNNYLSSLEIELN